MPQWPSMLTSQSTYQQPLLPTASASSTPLSASTSLSAPASAPASVPPPNSRRPSQTGSTPRKTLTDADRRRMCLYHEENPTTKQTEIGALFGVERSTVSKVLRNKEKYLFQDDGGRSPIKRSKGKFPDIERALSNWARNHQRQGLPLSDSIIREKARFFATTVGNSESHLKLNSNSWLEKFKQKNNLMGARSRKSSLAAEEAGEASNPASNSGTPNGISPVSASGLASPSPISMSATRSDEGIKPESPDSFGELNSAHRPFHSQSNNSLSSVFTDTAPSSFSAGPTSPTSPFFTPDSMFAPNQFITQQSNETQAQVSSNSNNTQRPRRQTFPTLGVEPYVSPPTSSEALTPKYLNSTALDSSALESPISEMPPTLSIDHSMPPPMQPRAGSSDHTMQPPPPPQLSTSSHHSPIGGTPGSASPASASPTQDDARRALELVMDFFQHQPSGFVEPQEFVTIGKLMEKLRVHRTPPVQELPGGLHRIPEREFITRQA
ncbi:MAG: hypothetical protein Q9165_003162 [Trypethelium subeluteriae]